MSHYSFHLSYHRIIILSFSKVNGSQIYLESARFVLFHLSAMKIYLSFIPSTARIYVLCALKVLSPSAPTQGLSIICQSPITESATAYIAAFGSQPVHNEVTR